MMEKCLKKSYLVKNKETKVDINITSEMMRVSWNEVTKQIKCWRQTGFFFFFSGWIVQIGTGLP